MSAFYIKSRHKNSKRYFKYSTLEILLYLRIIRAILIQPSSYYDQ